MEEIETDLKYIQSWQQRSQSDVTTETFIVNIEYISQLLFHSSVSIVEFE